MLIAFGCAALVTLSLLFYWNDLEKRLDAFCVSKAWAECAATVPGDISLHWPFVDSSGSAQGLSQGAEQGAPATLLQNYFLDLSGARTEQSQTPSAAAVAVIVDRAKFYEYQWHFSHLSEAYGRCAVGLYRKRAKAALANLGSNKQAAAESLESLANSLRHLAELYQRHGKYLIAEKALKESIDVATQAFALADQKSAERLRAELLVDYGAHIKILNDLGRTPEAERESKLLLDQ
jgi:tetratricopeptide (TPR) repeat protein